MPEFSFSARVVYDGAVVIIRADTADEARKKAEAGDWADCELQHAARADWDIGSRLRD